MGQPNPYGHPTPELPQELSATGTGVVRTDQHGAITISFTDHGPVVAFDR